jgi:hypothetical protein
MKYEIKTLFLFLNQNHTYRVEFSKQIIYFNVKIH